MLTVKCPHCQAAMKLRQAPPSGKVKCPRCSQAVPVRPAAVPAGGGQAVDPDDDGFDFGRINFPSASPAAAVSHFPVQQQVSAYEGPIPGDPLEAVTEEEAESYEEAGMDMTPAATKQKPKMSTGMVVGILGGVGALMIVAILIGTQMGGDDAGEDAIDVVAAAEASAPAGYTAFGVEGCVVLMPEGSVSKSLPSAIESRGVLSSATESYFFMGAMDGGTRELTIEQIKKKSERLLGGDVLGPMETQRNGYKGVKGTLATSIFLPRMQVEMYHVDARFVIIGAAAAEMVPGAPPKNRSQVGTEQDIFFKSFRIGPKPSGWW